MMSDAMLGKLTRIRDQVAVYMGKARQAETEYERLAALYSALALVERTYNRERNKTLKEKFATWLARLEGELKKD